MEGSRTEKGTKAEEKEKANLMQEKDAVNMMEGKLWEMIHQRKRIQRGRAGTVNKLATATNNVLCWRKARQSRKSLSQSETQAGWQSARNISQPVALLTVQLHKLHPYFFPT